MSIDKICSSQQATIKMNDAFELASKKSNGFNKQNHTTQPVIVLSRPV